MAQPDLETTPPSWWGRNWKWVLPVGCLTPVLLCGGFIAAILAIVFGALKSSDAYTEALARAQKDRRVQAALGEPIEAGFFVSGNISLNNDRGHADLRIPISGPNGNATIYVVANKAAGKWTYTRLDVVPDGGERIDLLKQP